MYVLSHIVDTFKTTLEITMFIRTQSRRGILIGLSCITSLLLTSCSDDGSTTNATTDNQTGIQLSADQQVPPLNLPNSTGLAALVIDAETGAVSGTVTVSGLSGPATMAHIHSGAAGTTGPVLIGLDVNDDESSFTVPPNATLDAPGIENYLTSELYVNVHTELYPAGEIRGQIIPIGVDGRTRFSVQITNVSTEQTLSTPSNGGTVAVPLSPGAYIVHQEARNPLLDPRSPSSAALEALAEDGNASLFPASIPTSVVFDTPDGASEPGPLMPGNSYTFSFTAVPGDELAIATMFVQSNDWFYSTTDSNNDSIPLFTEAGEPVSGDFSDQLSLWESDTEEDQEPGTGTGQAPRQATSGDVGTPTLNGTVGSLAGKGKAEDASSVLNSDVITVTITAVQ